MLKPDPMLVACRDLAVKMLTESLDHFFAKLEDTYFELGDKSFDRKQRDDYYAARLETHNKRALIAEQFRGFLNAEFDKSAKKNAPEVEQKFYFVNANPEQLSLVANEEYEENITADKVVKSIKDQGGDELAQLELRLARLLPVQDGDISNNPVSPEAICQAFLQACKQLETGVDARMIAMQAFERELSGQVADVYHQINQYLITQNVQPLPRHLRDRQGRARAKTEIKAKLAEMPDLAEHLSHLANHEVSEQESKALETLRQAPGWLAFLDLLQRKAPPTTALNDEAGEPLAHNLLGLLRDTGWAKQLPQIDAMTLELVAMLFEHIFDDPRLSPTVKSLIGRLQIPVLKVGMMDADFFASKKHPARLLLDELAWCAADSHEFELGMPRYEATAEIINHLIKVYEKDILVFEQALTQLRAINQQYDEQISATLSEETDQLTQHELAELSQVTSEQLVKQLIAKYVEIPEAIIAFLNTTWIDALRVSYGALGESEPKFSRRLEAMENLLWSIQPKADADERFKMVNLLPVMLKELEDGASEAGLSKELSQAFFSDLVQCHAAAIRNGIKNPPPKPQVSGAVQPSNAASVTSAAISSAVEEDVKVIAIEENVSILPQKGEWVELIDEQGDAIAMRLSWVSPQQTRYLFTNRKVKGMAFLKAELEAAIRAGRVIRLALEGSITDRAMQGLMDDFS